MRVGGSWAPRAPSVRRPPAASPSPSAAPPPPPPQTASLIPDTLAALAADPEHQALIATVSAPGGQAALTAAERAARRRALDALGVPPFARFVAERVGGSDSGSDSGSSGPPARPPLIRGPAATLQVNVGLYCNQACRHCHVESSPLRTAEMMDERTADQCLDLAAGCASLKTLDLTGGAPELNTAVFRRLVTGGRDLGLTVIDRCNLTVLSEPGQEGLAAFLAEQGVRVVASLPCYTPATVDAQRGRGVFERSIDGLRALNALGYGRPGTGLVLDLVYNPAGAFLAPPQASLEPAYRAELADTYGIAFSNLIALNNMPIKRFADDLSKTPDGLRAYMDLLVTAFNPAAVAGLMCVDTISVGWDGSLFDCDFNQQLALPLRRGLATVFDVGSLADLEGEPIAVGCHCFGCTAGAGSGCGGQKAD
jgi:radical SAM/Cys-rich protein